MSDVIYKLGMPTYGELVIEIEHLRDSDIALET